MSCRGLGFGSVRKQTKAVEERSSTASEGSRLPRWVATMETFMVPFSVGAMEVITVEVMEVVAAIEVFVMTWVGSMVAIPRIEVMIDVSIVARTTVVPRASTDEGAAAEPFRAVVAIRGAVVRGVAVVPVRANRCGPANIHAKRNLSLCGS